MLGARSSRLAAILVLAFTAVVTVLGAAGPAGASTNWVGFTPSDATTGPFDGETLPITGAYTTSGGGSGPIDILECAAAGVPADGAPLDRSWCDSANVTTGIRPDPSTGAFSGWFAFDLDFTAPATGAAVDCSQSGACALVADASPPGDVAAAMSLKGVPGCNGAFDGAPVGSLSKSTNPVGGSSPTAADPVVAPGTSIQVTLTWNSSDFSGTTSEVSDCIQIGADRTDLATQRKPGPAPGPSTTTWSTTYTVPAGTADGSVICDRGRVSGTPAGQGAATQKSNEICFAVGPPAQTPEFPWAMAGGVIALGLLGSYGFRRRRARAS